MNNPKLKYINITYNDGEQEALESHDLTMLGPFLAVYEGQRLARLINADNIADIDPVYADPDQSFQ